MGLQGLVDVVVQGGVAGVGQVLHMEELLRLGNAPGSEGGGLGLLVHDVVSVDSGVLFLLVVHLDHNALFQAGDEHLRHVVHLGGLFALAGDDQGGTGLVDQDGVHLVHDGEGVAPLHQLLLVDGHVVTQIVEAQLVVGAVSNVGGVGGAALAGLHTGDHQAHGEPHVPVDLAHPLGVALCQVFVDGDHMDASAGEGVQVAGQDCHQGLAFTGFHFGDAALVQHDAAHELDGVGTHAQHPVGSLPDGGKGLGQQLVQRFALGVAVLEFLGLCFQGILGQIFVFGLQRQDLVHHGLDLFDLPLGAGSKQFCDKTHSGLLSVQLGMAIPNQFKEL